MDLHVYTDVSYDREMSVKAVLARTTAAGLDAVAITNHDSVEALPRTFDITHKYGARVIPGVEVSTADGHLLVLGIDDPPATRQPLSETA